MSGIREPITDGGPFTAGLVMKTPSGEIVSTATGGLSIRDWFAGQALAGLVAQSMGGALGSTPDVGARFAYGLADAMLAERVKHADADT